MKSFGDLFQNSGDILNTNESYTQNIKIVSFVVFLESCVLNHNLKSNFFKKKKGKKEEEQRKERTKCEGDGIETFEVQSQVN